MEEVPTLKKEYMAHAAHMLVLRIFYGQADRKR